MVKRGEFWCSNNHRTGSEPCIYHFTTNEEGWENYQECPEDAATCPNCGSTMESALVEECECVRDMWGNVVDICEECLIH